MPGGNGEEGGSSSGFPGAPGGNGEEGGFPSGFPGMPGENGEEGSFPSGFPGMPGGNGEEGGSSGFPGAPGNGGFSFGGMGSDDVKLQYIDDDPDSYANIFDNAKTEVSAADKKRLIEALKKLGDYTDMEEALDTDEVLRYFVVHNFVCNDDSYTGSMIHNYYLHESDGRLSMIPWDYNLAFGTFTGNDAAGTVNASIDDPVSGSVDDRPMVGWIFSDESYTERYHTLFAEFLERWFADGRLEKLIADTADMIRPYVEKDPTKFCTSEDFEKGVTALSQFVSLRAEAVGRQLAGDGDAVDAGSLDLSDMGTMNGGGAGREAAPSPDGTAREGVPAGQSGDSAKNAAQTRTDAERTDEPAEGFSAPQGFPSGNGVNAAFPGQSGGFPAGASDGRSEASFRALLGACALTLAAGLLIAVKKKVHHGFLWDNNEKFSVKPFSKGLRFPKAAPLVVRRSGRNPCASSAQEVLKGLSH